MSSMRDVNKKKSLIEAKQAAINQDQLDAILEKIEEYQTSPANEYEKKLYQIMDKCLKLANQIQSCDRPNEEKYKHNVNAVQIKSDEIRKRQMAELQKIVDIADLTFEEKAGNCQEKAYFGFYYMLQNLINEKFCDDTMAIPLKLGYFENHFVVVVAEHYLLDPWLGFYFKIPYDKKFDDVLESVFTNFGSLYPYFSIEQDWHCFSRPYVGAKFSSDLESTLLITKKIVEYCQSSPSVENKVEHQDTLSDNNENLSETNKSSDQIKSSEQAKSELAMDETSDNKDVSQSSQQNDMNKLNDVEEAGSDSDDELEKEFWAQKRKLLVREQSDSAEGKLQNFQEDNMNDQIILPESKVASNTNSSTARAIQDMMNANSNSNDMSDRKQKIISAIKSPHSDDEDDSRYERKHSWFQSKNYVEEDSKKSATKRKANALGNNNPNDSNESANKPSEPKKQKR